MLRSSAKCSNPSVPDVFHNSRRKVETFPDHPHTLQSACPVSWLTWNFSSLEQNGHSPMACSCPSRGSICTPWRMYAFNPSGRVLILGIEIPLLCPLGLLILEVVGTLLLQSIHLHHQLLALDAGVEEFLIQVSEGHPAVEGSDGLTVLPDPHLPPFFHISDDGQPQILPTVGGRGLLLVGGGAGVVGHRTAFRNGWLIRSE